MRRKVVSFSILGDYAGGGLCERKGHRMGQRLLFGRRRVIAATGAEDVYYKAEVGGHGASPVNFLSVIRFQLEEYLERYRVRSAFDGCQYSKWHWRLRKDREHTGFWRTTSSEKRRVRDLSFWFIIEWLN